MALDDFSATWDQYTIAPLPITASYGRSVNAELDKKPNIMWPDQAYSLQSVLMSDAKALNSNITYYEGTPELLATYLNSSNTYLPVSIRIFTDATFADTLGNVNTNYQKMLVWATIASTQAGEGYNTNRVIAENVSVYPVFVEYSDRGGAGYYWDIDVGLAKVPMGSYVAAYVRMSPQDDNDGPGYRGAWLYHYAPT